MQSISIAGQRSYKGAFASKKSSSVVTQKQDSVNRFEERFTDLESHPICILIVLLGRVFIKMRQNYFMVLSQPALLHWIY